MKKGRSRPRKKKKKKKEKGKQKQKQKKGYKRAPHGGTRLASAGMSAKN